MAQGTWDDDGGGALVAVDTSGLARENAYLRELLGQLDGIAHENMELQRRVAELEAELLALRRTAPAAIAKPRTAASTASAKGRANAPVAIRTAEPGALPILIVGPTDVSREPWAAYGRTELADIGFGLPAGAAVRYLTGPLPLRPAGGTHDDTEFSVGPDLGHPGAFQTVELNDAGEPLSADAWIDAVAGLAQTFRPRIAILTRPTRAQSPLVPRLAALGARVTLVCAHNELNDLIGWDFRLPPDEQARVIEAFAAASLVLTTSHWEREQLESLAPQRLTLDTYIRGIDLTRFSNLDRPLKPFTKVLFVADRSGPLGLKAIRDAARDLEAVPGITIEMVTDVPGRDTINLTTRHLAEPLERPRMFKEADIVVVPLECGGFSQTLMEALASGCACLTPETPFGRYPPDSPFQTYSGRRGHLAEQIARLHADTALRAQLQARAVRFAAASLPRSTWADWLRNCMSWLATA